MTTPATFYAADGTAIACDVLSSYGNGFYSIRLADGREWDAHQSQLEFRRAMDTLRHTSIADLRRTLIDLAADYTAAAPASLQHAASITEARRIIAGLPSPDETTTGTNLAMRWDGWGVDLRPAVMQRMAEDIDDALAAERDACAEVASEMATEILELAQTNTPQGSPIRDALFKQARVAKAIAAKIRRTVED